MAATTTAHEQKTLEALEREEAANTAGIPAFTKDSGVITVSMNEIPGYRVVRVLGSVYGITVRSRNWAAGLGGVFRSVVGGEIKFFNTMFYRARNTAVERMIGECVGRGGNAVIAMRFDTTEYAGMSQVCAYGTACVVEKLDDGRPDARASLLAEF